MLPQNLVQMREDQVTDIATAQDLLEHKYNARYETTTLHEMSLHDDGTVAFVASKGTTSRLPFAQPVLESLATYIGMGLNYAYDIPFDLFRENFDQRKRPCSRGLALCIVNDVVVNTAQEDYQKRRALSSKIVAGLEFEDNDWRFERAYLADEGISINMLHATQVVEPKPGDSIRVGIRITNSETGGHFAKATVYTERVVCSNGAVIAGETGTVWWNADKRMQETTKHNVFRKRIGELLQTAFPATTAIYSGVADRHIRERELVHLIRRMNYVLHSTEQVDRILGIPPTDRYRIQLRVRQLDPGDYGERTPWCAFDLHNNVTAGARTIAPSARSSRFSLHERLEEIGGDLLFCGTN